MPRTDQLNRETVSALMEARGIDGIAHLGRRIAAVAHDDEAVPERSYLSRVLRGQRPAQHSLVLLIARALKVSPIAITGPDFDPEAEEIIEAAAS